jgi:hypothetical protein
MSGSSKSKNSVWHGYLEAGNRSSPVIHDDKLETGSAKTMFLFNLERREILEYSREIVEPKLRELKSSEIKLIKALDAAYTDARRHFKDRRARALNIPEHGGPAQRPMESRSDEDIDQFVDDGGEDVWADSDED